MNMLRVRVWTLSRQKITLQRLLKLFANHGNGTRARRSGVNTLRQFICYSVSFAWRLIHNLYHRLRGSLTTPPECRPDNHNIEHVYITTEDAFD